MAITGQIVTEPDGRQFVIVDFRAKFPYPFDLDSPFFLLAAMSGGYGVGNLPLIGKGDPGQAALIDQTIERTWLEYDDPTPESVEWVEIQPATDTQPQKVRLREKVRRGKPGLDGTSRLVPADYGTPVARQFLALNATADAFEYVPQRIGGRHWPSAVTEAGAGSTGAKRLAVVSIPAKTYAFPHQFSVSGGSVVTGSGADVKVNLVARLNAENGPVLGMCPGIGGTTDRLILIDGPDTNTAAATVTAQANAASSVYLMAEKVAGADSFATGSIPTRVCVDVRPAAL